jgi:ribokinase/non-canonical purine NTP pyrophosphatase (RdgB/HAM1 family)
MNANSIVVVGSANVDLTTYTNSAPGQGETVLGKEFKTSLGGKGANQAVAAALLSAPNSIHFICKVGNDDYGMELIRNFDKRRILYNPNNVISKKNHTGIAAITVTSTGENSIIVVPGSNHDLSVEEVKNQLVEIQQFKKIDVVMTQLEVNLDVALMAMKIGRECSALTILNPAPAPDFFDDDFFDYVDMIVPNESELRKLVRITKEGSIEDMAKELLKRGIRKAVIVTLGAKGAMIIQRKTELENEFEVDFVNAPQELQNANEPVIDTVGAGDAFCGSLAVYLASGSQLLDAVMKACGVASLSVRKIGAQSSYPTFYELPPCLRLGLHSVAFSSTKQPLTFVTGNKKKLEEVKKILSQEETDIPFYITNKNLDLPELQGRDPVAIAIEKCKLAAKDIQGPVFIEDTSLCFNALNGMPGMYIKWFLEKLGHDGLNKILDGFDDKSAYAQTVIAFTAGFGEEIHTFEGRTYGKIVPARGSLDFGW